MNIISREWHHYNMLSQKTRTLISSFALRSLANPLLTLFINSFIWRSTSSVFNVAIYNLGFFIFLPVGFYINGLLLKKTKITKLHLIGLIISTISTIAIIFFSGNNLLHFLVYGFIFGLGSGFYWANRNFLSLQETNSEQRNYFFSINSVFGGSISLCVTFLMGWFIVLGENSNLYAPIMAYWAFGILASIFLILSGILLLKNDYRSPKVKRIFQPHMTSRWNKARFINVSMGLVEGMGFFLPALLILFYLGKEGVLGTISTIVTLFIISITYIYGRLAKQGHRKPIYFMGLLLYIMLAYLLIFWNSNLNILPFVLFSGLTSLFQYIAIQPALLDIINEETNKNIDNQYTFIFDQELFLNAGRIIGVLIFLFIIKISSEQAGLLYTPLFLGTLQLILMSFIWNKKII